MNKHNLLTILIFSLLSETSTGPNLFAEPAKLKI